MKGLSKLKKAHQHLSKAKDLMQEFVNSRTDYYEGRSYSWQELDKGIEFGNVTDDIEMTLDDVDAVCDELNDKIIAFESEG